MKAEHTKVFNMTDGSQLKVTSFMLAIGHGHGCEIEYIHVCFNSTDGHLWSPVANTLNPDQLHMVNLELWQMLKPIEPMVSFL